MRRSRGIATSLPAFALTSTVVAASGSASPQAFPGAAGKIVLSGGTLINPDGSGSTKIPIPGSVGITWSADGKWLAYSTGPEPWVIRVARPDGTGDREVLPASAGAPVTSPAYAWSPSGTEIAYPCATGLCAVRVADGTTRRVVDLASPARASNPTWSPDGSRIAFGCPFIAPLCMVRPDGSDPVTYTSGLPISFPDWSPDGTRILFSSRGKVYTLDVDDGEVRLLVDMGAESSARARWAPDGQSMLIRSFPDIYVMRFTAVSRRRSRKDRSATGEPHRPRRLPTRAPSPAGLSDGRWGVSCWLARRAMRRSCRPPSDRRRLRTRRSRLRHRPAGTG